MAAERILPHVADRPVSIIRAPEGIGGETFFQRHAMPGSNPRLKLIDVKERKPYVGVVDVGGLVAIGQSGGLELHPWGCAPGDPETPDQITFDLDPDEGLDFDDVIAAAKVVKTRLEALGLNPFVKTTGGKGLHVVVPIKADASSRDRPGTSARPSPRRCRERGPRRCARPLHHHPGQEGAGRKDLPRLSAQRPDGDGGRALVAARPARRRDRLPAVAGGR